MIKKIRQFLIVGVAGLTMMFSGLALPLAGGVASAASNITDSLCEGVNTAAEGSSSTDCSTNDDTGSQGIKDIATKVTNIFSIIVGAIAVIMIIVGGFRYITSGGDSNRVGGAKNTLIYAIIGLIIVALAQLIIHFVLTQAGNATENA